MMSHLRQGGPGWRQAAIVRVLASHAGRWPAAPWAGPGACVLGQGRAPEESYRDYLFRRDASAPSS